MEVKAITGDIAAQDAGAVIVGVFEETESPGEEAARLDAALYGAVTRLIEAGEIKGKLNEVTVVHSLGRLPAARVAVVGMGKKDELTLERLRGVAAEALRYLQRKRVSGVAMALPGAGVGDITVEEAAQAVTEGALLGTYSFRRHMTKGADSGEIETFTIVGKDNAALTDLESGIGRGRVLAGAAMIARDMVNEPGNFKTPTDMAEVAAVQARTYGLDLTVLEREQMQEMGMGALLGVAQGSQQPPKLIILRYRVSDSEETDIALIGKGITFDS